MQCVGAQIVAGRWPPPAAACRTCCLLAPHVTPGSHHRGADAQRSWVALIEKGLDFEIRKVGAPALARAAVQQEHASLQWAAKHRAHH